MNGEKYCTMRIAPSVRANLKRISENLKKHNNLQWSESRVVNLALIDWIQTLAKLNDAEIERLFDSYEELKTGHGLK